MARGKRDRGTCIDFCPPVCYNSIKSEVFGVKLTNEEKQAVTAAILRVLAETPAATRRQIIDGAMLRYAPDMKRPSPAEDEVGAVRSYIGTVLNDLVAKQDVVGADNGYTLTKETPVIVREEQCETAIKRLLAVRPYGKGELYRALDRHFGTDRTATREDDCNLHTAAGTVLSRLVKTGVVAFVDGSYRLASAVFDGRNDPLPEAAFKERLLERLHLLGGAFFERFAAGALEKYYLITGREVLTCTITGGSDDGGVDIIIDTVDDLGFVERVMVQAKCRDQAQVTEKEVREFFGALTARGGSRGIYITTAGFHPAADRLLKSIPNCVGVDGDKLFEIVKKTAYGIHRTAAGYTFDETIFGL